MTLKLWKSLNVIGNVTISICLIQRISWSTSDMMWPCLYVALCLRCKHFVSLCQSYSWVMTVKSCFCTTLWCIVNQNACFRLLLFCHISISQGSVATHWRCGRDVLLLLCYKFITKSVSERIFKNRWMAGKVRGKNIVVPFSRHDVSV